MEYDGINSVEIHEGFKRDFKKLKKRYRSLKDDLDTFIDTSVRAVHVLDQPPESQGHFPVSGLGIKVEGLYVAKRFACKSLKGTASRSGIRVVYRFEKKTLYLYLIEIFYKGDKENEDVNRIKSIFQKVIK